MFSTTSNDLKRLGSSAVLTLNSPALNSWYTSVLNLNGTPYWDGNSWDGNDLNIGNYLTGTGGFAGGTNYGTLPYWA